MKRAYDPVENEDGYRVLVDRLWPRGVSKQDLQLDQWMKEIAPSNELRKWFDHDPEKVDRFRERYEKELERHPELVEELLTKGQNKTVTLIYSAKNRDYNNAVALKSYLEEQLGL